MEHLSFAYYKLPHENHYRYIGSTTPPLPITQLSEITNDLSGFLVVPFDTENFPILLISAEDTYTQVLLPTPSPVIKHVAPTPVDAYYLQSFEGCKKMLDGDRLQKIVLSHRFTSSQEFQPNVTQLFTDAANAFPKCYVALWHTPETGFWLTITPEVLLESEGANQWHTMALAGTMQKEETEWSEKNKKEQQCVTDYITSVISPLSTTFSHSEIQTIEAAQLKHLRTDFYFTTAHHIGEILSQLHPTPAVCGLPKIEAYEAIKKIETSPRKYYAGCSGLLNVSKVNSEGPNATGKDTHLFVTLRCAHWDVNAPIEYYAGGGLLKESKADEEWFEINTKKQTAECIVTKHISTI